MLASLTTGSLWYEMCPNSFLQPRKYTSMDRGRWAVSFHRMQVEAAATSIAVRSSLAVQGTGRAGTP
jgi:hypothetical protein